MRRIGPGRRSGPGPRRPQRPSRRERFRSCGPARPGVPVTVHTTVGAEIIHQHPLADGAALGATSLRDFRRLAGALPDLHEGGVVLNLGSAVVLPEVFLKALTIARNLGEGRPTGFLAADFDMIRHYRPRVNVVERPTRGGGNRTPVHRASRTHAAAPRLDGRRLSRPPSLKSKGEVDGRGSLAWLERPAPTPTPDSSKHKRPPGRRGPLFCLG